jgi:hypothetical protein
MMEQSTECGFQSIKNKLMTNYFLSLCNPLFIRVSKYSTIEWE